MVVECKCDNCRYCQRTTDFFVCWCGYWNKVVYLTGGCVREDDR